MRRSFAHDQFHGELTGFMHLWEGTRAFTTRQRLLSADQYEIVDVRTDRGMTRAMLSPRAILKAEWDASFFGCLEFELMQEVNCCRFYTLINRKTWPPHRAGPFVSRREVGPPVSLDGFPWAPSLSVLSP